MDNLTEYKLPYEFDLFLDCKNMEQLIRVYHSAKCRLDTITDLLDTYQSVDFDFLEAYEGYIKELENEK